MFKCFDCGAVFDEPETYEEHHPYGMTYAVEKWAICPACRSANIDEYREEEDEE